MKLVTQIVFCILCNVYAHSMGIVCAADMSDPIPLPCQEVLKDRFRANGSYTFYGSRESLFQGCDGLFLSCARLRSFLKDFLIVRVGQRMQNLYLGSVDVLNPMSSTLFQYKSISGIQANYPWRSTVSKLPAWCEQAGACNPFVDTEIQMKLPALKAQADISTFLGLETTGYPLFGPHELIKFAGFDFFLKNGLGTSSLNSMFLAKGVFKIQNTTLPPLPQQARTQESFLAALPQHRIIAAAPRETGICYADKRKVIFDKNNITLRSLTVKDATQTGSQNCTGLYMGIWDKASMVSSLHTGALVQAYWVELQAMIDSLSSATGSLVVDNVCTAPLNSFKDNMRRYLSLASFTNRCVGTSTADMRSALAKECTGGATAQDALGKVAACYELSALETLTFQQFVDVLDCQIVRNAHERFKKAFIDNDNPKKLVQLQLLATTSCMTAFDDYVYQTKAQGAGVSSDSASATEECVTIPNVEDPSQQGQVLCPSHSDYQSQLLKAKNQGANQLSFSVRQCWIFAYTSLLKQYLATSASKLSMVPLQQQYASDYGLLLNSQKNLWDGPERASCSDASQCGLPVIIDNALIQVHPSFTNISGFIATGAQ